MQQSLQNHFVGLDIGTSTVRCVVGMVDAGDSSKPSIIGYGSAPNTGSRKGAVVHVEDATDAIIRAITEAERIAGVQISRATVNINGAHVEGMDSRGVIAISSANREITPDDRMRVEEAATVIKMPPNREIIQFFAKNYSLDGQRGIKDPLGMSGVRLEVDAHIVTAATPSLRNLDLALQGAQIMPTNHTVSSLAAAEAVLGRQQKEAGTVVLDIGAGTTNLIVIEDGEVQHVAVLPIGGMHITNDLAIGLKTDLEVAEAVKVQHATLAETTKAVASVKVNDEMHHFKMDDVQMIVEARVEELFEYANKELLAIGRARKLPGGVMLAGGTAQFPGLSTFAREQLELPARVGKLQTVSGLADAIDDPAYFTVIGLMLLDMLLLPTAGQNGLDYGQPNSKAFGFVEGFLGRFRK
ncbi:MAG TPA: cell division protein FtsA [Candidatus Saccharimonadales bacterium]|nr:cell division protein FtsA [Candidatus Saccharimonadales bacterium]